MHRAAWAIALLLLSGCMGNVGESGADIEPPPPNNLPESQNRTEANTTEAPEDLSGLIWSSCVQASAVATLPRGNVEPHVPDSYVIVGGAVVNVIVLFHACESTDHPNGSLELSTEYLLTHVPVEPITDSGAAAESYLLEAVASSPQVKDHLTAWGIHAVQGEIQASLDSPSLHGRASFGDADYALEAEGFTEGGEQSPPSTMVVFHQGPANKPSSILMELQYQESTSLRPGTFTATNGMMGTMMDAGQHGVFAIHSTLNIQASALDET